MLITFLIQDGSNSELGSQVIPALCGYLLGILGACSAFRFGRDTAFWLHSWKNPDNSPDYGKDDRGEEDRETITECGWRHYWTKSCVFLVAIVLIALFVLGSVVHEIQFYRNMIMMSLVAPFGAVLRWKLSMWNSDRNTNCWQFLPWLPWGTLSANLLGAIISILCTGFLDSNSQAIFDPWVEALLFAVKVGFAGSLSTVSSMVKDIAVLSEKYPGHAKPHIYGSVTIVSAMLISLGIYAGIVRSIQ
jgi:fluoride ion exporter CrcB/FEX